MTDPLFADADPPADPMARAMHLHLTEGACSGRVTPLYDASSSKFHDPFDGPESGSLESFLPHEASLGDPCKTEKAHEEGCVWGASHCSRRQFPRATNLGSLLFSARTCYWHLHPRKEERTCSLSLFPSTSAAVVIKSAHMHKSKVN